MIELADISTTPDTDVGQAISRAFEELWNVILFNDDNISIDVPIVALMKVIGLSTMKATEITFHVHRNGKGIVATTTFERAELFHARLTEEYNLTVSIEKMD